jgi:hypothetical protein
VLTCYFAQSKNYIRSTYGQGFVELWLMVAELLDHKLSFVYMHISGHGGAGTAKFLHPEV